MSWVWPRRRKEPLGGRRASATGKLASPSVIRSLVRNNSFLGGRRPFAPRRRFRVKGITGRCEAVASRAQRISGRSPGLRRSIRSRRVRSPRLRDDAAEASSTRLTAYRCGGSAGFAWLHRPAHRTSRCTRLRVPRGGHPIAQQRHLRDDANGCQSPADAVSGARKSVRCSSTSIVRFHGVPYGASGARLGELLHVQLARHSGDPVVDVLRAVVRVEPLDLEGKRLISASSAGTGKRSESASTAATNSYCVTSSTRSTSSPPSCRRGPSGGPSRPARSLDAPVGAACGARQS